MKPFTRLYELYVLLMVIMMNFFFLMFVHNKYDYSPNLALFIISFPIIVIQLRVLFIKDDRSSKSSRK